jgi:signal transduction histidine kinase
MVFLKRIIPILLFLGLIACPVFAKSQMAEQSIILDGIHKFSPDDNPAYSFPDYNDSQWKSVTVPGSWQAQRIKPAKGVGWYRIHFTLPGSFKTIKPALLLGRIGDVDEVFLNGLKIGGEGLIGNRFVEATKVERLYQLPESHLRYDSTNVITIRVMNTYLNGGIFDKGVIIGDYNALLAEKLQRDRNILIVEFCFFTFFAVFFVSCFFFYLKGLRDKEYLYFLIFTSIYGILFVLGSVTFYHSGLKSPFIQQTLNALTTILPASLVLLINVYQEKLTYYIKVFLVVFPLIALAIILFPGHISRIYFYKVWKVFFILAATLMVFHAVRAYYKKINESGPILLGITGLIMGFILESVGGLDLLQMTGFFLWDYSAVFFMICVMYALTSRYTRIKEELKKASLKIFDAHEDERKRLARELHDGVGQSLLSVKLQLKMLESSAKKGVLIHEESFSELVSDISHSIDEIRSIAMDLRPSFLENIEFAEAIKWHAGKIQEQSGIHINIHIADLVEIDSTLKENIYRIYQEALSNAIKHSGASTVDVILKMDTAALLFEIKDDGKGFTPAQIEKRGTGIGLYTIKERVELLGGILRINSSDKIGTSIHIEVPLP